MCCYSKFLVNVAEYIIPGYMCVVRTTHTHTHTHPHYTTYLCIYWCGAVCWDPERGGQVSCLNRVQNGAVKFSNNINESCWDTLAQGRLIPRICALFKACTGRRAWKAIGNRILKQFYVSRDDHNRKIRSRK